MAKLIVPDRLKKNHHPIHDWFDGESACVECEGPCQLYGPQRVITRLVRDLFEETTYVVAHQPQGLPEPITFALGPMSGATLLGILEKERLQLFMDRARDTNNAKYGAPGDVVDPEGDTEEIFPGD